MSRPAPAAAALAFGLMAAGAVWAVPPAVVVSPQASMDTDRILGRWYEILRMPNKIQRNCFAAYQVWARKDDGYTVQQVCHRDGPEGKVAEVTVTAKPLNADNTLFDTSFFGGLIHQKYVLVDIHAPDYSWLISTTADGRFPKLHVPLAHHARRRAGRPQTAPGPTRLRRGPHGVLRRERTSGARDEDEEVLG